MPATRQRDSHHAPTPPRLARRARALVALLLSVALLPAAASCGSNEPRNLLRSIESGTVILGTKFDQPGLAVRTPGNTFEGVDADVSRYVVHYIAEKRGWKQPELRWRETPSPQRETLIRNGEVDMIAATYSINAGRLNAVDFAGPYLQTHQGLLVREDSTIRGLQDMGAGTMLCSVTGSTPAQKVKKALPQVQLQEFDTYSSCVEALANRKVDALTTDATILAGFAQQYPGQMRVVELRKPDGAFWTNENYGIGMSKGQPDSVAAVNEALTEMYRSGEFERIVHRNLGEDFAVGPMPAIGDLSFTTKK